MDRKKSVLAATAIFLILAIFTGTALGATAEDLDRSAGTLNPGKVSKIKGPPYSISADTAVIQRIKVEDNNTDGNDVNVVKVTINNTGPDNSATFEDLAQIALLDQDGNILALTEHDATGLSFPIAFDGEREIDDIETPGLPYLIADGSDAILQIAVVVAANPTDKHVLQVESSVAYKEGDAGIVTRGPLTDGAAETIRDTGAEEVSDQSADAGRIVAGNSAIVQKVQITDNDAAYWDVKLTGVKVENQGSAINTDVELIEVLDEDGHVIASDKPTDDRFNFTHGGFRISISHIVADDTSTTLQIRVTLAKDARQGRTIQLKTWIEQEEPAGYRYPNAVAVDGSPESIVGITGNAKITIGGGTRIKGLRDPMTLGISITGFPSPGLNGLQVGPEHSLYWDPNVIDVTAIEGEGPYQVRYDPDTNIDHEVGKATFTLLLQENKNPITSGKIVKLTVRASDEAAAGDQTKINLSYDILRDDDGNDVFAAVAPGVVKIGILGDVDFDNQVLINDAVMVAKYLLGLQDLTAEQQKVADYNQDGSYKNDVYVPNVDSTDVRLIAEQALAEASGTAKARLSYSPAKQNPIIGLFSSLVRGITGLFRPAAEVTLAQGGGGLTVSIDTPSGVAAAGIQGRLSFQPGALLVEKIYGLNGWTVLASSIDNRSGQAEFLAIKLSGDRAAGALQFAIVSKGEIADPPRLTLDALIDFDCRAIPYRVDLAETTPPAQPVEAFQVEGLSVRRFSSTSQDTMVFTVRGSGIAEVQVRLFNLAGGLVLDDAVSGNSLELDLNSPEGVRLANGVYLYLVTVRGANGQLYRSKLGKLVVLR